MKTTMLIGLILVILGIVLLGYQGYAYFTTQDTVARIGPLTVQGPREHAVPLAPILSTITLVGGIVLLVIGSAKAKPR